MSNLVLYNNNNYYAIGNTYSKILRITRPKDFVVKIYRKGNTKLGEEFITEDSFSILSKISLSDSEDYNATINDFEIRRITNNAENLHIKILIEDNNAYLIFNYQDTWSVECVNFNTGNIFEQVGDTSLINITHYEDKIINDLPLDILNDCTSYILDNTNSSSKFIRIPLNRLGGIIEFGFSIYQVAPGIARLFLRYDTELQKYIVTADISISILNFKYKIDEDYLYIGIHNAAGFRVFITKYTFQNVFETVTIDSVSDFTNFTLKSTVSTNDNTDSIERIAFDTYQSKIVYKNSSNNYVDYNGDDINVHKDSIYSFMVKSKTIRVLAKRTDVSNTAKLYLWDKNTSRLYEAFIHINNDNVTIIASFENQYIEYYYQDGYVYVKTLYPDYANNELVIQSYNKVKESDVPLSSKITPKYEIGSTSLRPTSIYIGFQYFDTTLNKPIWWTGTKWIDATGTSV